jgi:diacylglycerol O-acyltransferase / trehalose O-mycolyltransferase
MRAVSVLVALLAVLVSGCSGGTKAAPPAVANVLSEQPAGQRLVDLTIDSPAIGRAAKVRLMTPDGWAQRAGKTWPALYLLHGCCDTYDSWSRETDIRTIPELRRLLVVMPEGGEVGWYSDWWNHDKGGAPAWEQFHLTELRKLLEQDYGAGPQRVIAGVSMGGLGTLLYAAHNPGMFRAAASFSGVVHPLLEGFPEGLARTQRAYGEDPLALWGDSVAQRAVWEQHDPYYLTDRLHSIPVFMSAGNGRAGPFDLPGTNDDLEAFLGQMNQATAQRFQQAGLNLRTDFYGPGTHTWPYWQRELHRALPMLLAALRQ